MDYDALTAAQRRAYHNAVCRSHCREIELQILTRDGKHVRSLTNRFVGGNVTGDVTRVPMTVLDADLLDDDFVLDWSRGQWRRYMARVVDSRFVPALNDWVETVVFTGPLWDFQRPDGGPIVHLVAHDTSRLAMGSVRHVFTRGRKAKASEVIRDLCMAAGAVRRNLRIPHLNRRLPERVLVGVRRDGPDKDKAKDDKPRRFRFRADTGDTYWGEADRIADAIDRDLYPDGRGRFVLEARQKRPMVTFTPDTLTAPVVERRPVQGEVTNTWVVVGAKPKGKPRVEVTVALPPKHPDSAQKLAWNNTPHRVIERSENKHLRTEADARALGQRHRDRAMRETIEYEVDAVPVVPWLRPWGLVSVPTESGRARVRIKQWTLPLGPGADSLVIGAARQRGWHK